MSFAHAMSHPSFNDRRIAMRHGAMTALSICDAEKPNRAAVTVNVSASGMLFRSQEPIALGTELELSFPNPRVDGDPIQVSGTVVREAGHLDFRDTLFPHLAAVRFDAPLAPSDLPYKPTLR